MGIPLHKPYIHTAYICEYLCLGTWNVWGLWRVVDKTCLIHFCSWFHCYVVYVHLEHCMCLLLLRTKWCPAIIAPTSYKITSLLVEFHPSSWGCSITLCHGGLEWHVLGCDMAKTAKIRVGTGLPETSETAPESGWLEWPEHQVQGVLVSGSTSPKSGHPNFGTMIYQKKNTWK